MIICSQNLKLPSANRCVAMYSNVKNSLCTYLKKSVKRVGRKELEELHVEINELSGMLNILFPSPEIHKHHFANLKIKLTRHMILTERTSKMEPPFVAN